MAAVHLQNCEQKGRRISIFRYQLEGKMYKRFLGGLKCSDELFFIESSVKLQYGNPEGFDDRGALVGDQQGGDNVIVGLQEIGSPPDNGKIDACRPGLHESFREGKVRTVWTM